MRRELCLDKVEVYYFSGTGNSLVVARDIARKINGELISIASVIDKESIKTDANMIGIVFPVYNQGIPFIIKRFINKVDNLGKKYIFGVCTCGDSPCLSIECLDKLIKSKKAKLAAGFAVKMPYNYISPTFVLKDFLKSFTLREISFERQQKMFNDWEKKLEIVSQFVNARKEGISEINSRVIERLVDSLNLRETLQKVFG